MALTTYPNDAKFNPLVIPSLSRITYTGDGSNSTFTLGEPAEKVGEVVIVIDGTAQDTSTYSLNTRNPLNGDLFDKVTLDVAPESGVVVDIRTIRLPSSFEIVRRFPSVKTVLYTGDTPRTLNGNTYLIDGQTVAWSLPENSRVSSKDDILVSVNGVTQNSADFTFPSNELGRNGINVALNVEGTEPFANLDSDTGGISSLSITTFNKRRVTSRIQSMEDRKPDRSGISLAQNFDYDTYESEGGYQKRRLKSRRAKRGLQLKYTNITGLEKSAIEEFYRARSGGFEAFIFEMAHINETGTITVRFEGALEVNQVLSTGTNPIDNFYTVGFSLVEVFD